MTDITATSGSSSKGRYQRHSTNTTSATDDDSSEDEKASTKRTKDNSDKKSTSSRLSNRNEGQSKSHSKGKNANDNTPLPNEFIKLLICIHCQTKCMTFKVRLQFIIYIIINILSSERKKQVKGLERREK